LVKTRKLGSYPSILITFSLTIALFLIGFCGWLALNTKELVRRIKQNIEVQVYLDKEITQMQMDSLKNILAHKPFVAYENNIPQITFVSKEATARKFIEDTKEDYRNVLAENPFRNAFSIKVKENYFDESQLAKIKAELEPSEGIFEVDYAQGIVDSINKNVNKAYAMIAIFVILLLIATVVLINNTIRLALYSQRFIVRSMQLVGATDGFIQKPFLQRAVLQGLVAGLLASVLIFLLQEFARLQFNDFLLFQAGDNSQYSKLALLSIAIIVIGILINLVCTFQSVYRYLRLNLEELY
jgi:cell division transport system permease protein